MPSLTSDFCTLPALIAIAIGFSIWFIPTPEGVSAQGWLMLAIFVATIAAIIGKAMPIGAISIVAITVVAVSGVTSDNPGTAIRDALGSFYNSLIWLIAVAIMIS
jgi:DASS family divalent anion:Na+ symporter